MVIKYGKTTNSEKSNYEIETVDNCRYITKWAPKQHNTSKVSGDVERSEGDPLARVDSSDIFSQK